jgi:hypothetical protein
LVGLGSQVARRWNFAFFSTPGDKETGKGKIRAVQMEFETNVSFPFFALLISSLFEWRA